MEEEVFFLQKKTENAEKKLLAAYWKSLIKEDAEQGKYGSQHFDKPSNPTEEEEEGEDVDMFELHSCSTNCCDKDCECDDCLRCSNSGFVEEGESLVLRGVAG